MRVLLLLLLIHIKIFSFEYIPKTSQDKLNYIKLKREKVKVGLVENQFLKEEFQNESLIVYIKDFLENYLDLDVEYQIGSEEEIKHLLKNKSVSIAALIPKRFGNEEGIIYTDEVVESKYKKLDRSGIAPLSFGVRVSDSSSLDVINNALRYGYQKRIDEFLMKKNRELRKNIFLKSLTEEELEYFKKINTKEFKIAYIEANTLAYYSAYKKGYVGILPEIINVLEKELDFRIEEVKTRTGEFSEVYNLFDKNYTDIISMGICSDKDCSTKSGLSFTRELFKIPIYRVYNENVLNVSENKIGVVKKSIEGMRVNSIYLPQDLIFFSSQNEMLKAFANNKLKSMIVLDINRVSQKNTRARIVNVMGIHLVLKSKYSLEKSILDKIFEHYIDFEELNEKIEKDRNEILITKNLETKNHLFLLKSGVTLLFFMFITLLFNWSRSIKIEKQVTFDALTGLFGRNTFDKFCKNEKYEKGVAILIDLDNFKAANDKFGHHVGDEVLKEYSQIIKKVFRSEFGEQNLFRISGDEFYCFIEKNNYIIIIDELIKHLKRSDLLKRCEVGSSIGIYQKREKDSMKEAFMYADVAMYRAKKEKGHTFFLVEESNFFKDKESMILKKLMQKNSYTLKLKRIKNRYLDEDIVSIIPEVILETQILGEVEYKTFILVAEELEMLEKIELEILELVLKGIEVYKRNRDVHVVVDMHLKTLSVKNIWEKIEEILDRCNIIRIKINLNLLESKNEIALNEVFDNLFQLKLLKIDFIMKDLNIKSKKGHR